VLAEVGAPTLSVPAFLRLCVQYTVTYRTGSSANGSSNSKSHQHEYSVVSSGSVTICVVPKVGASVFLPLCGSAPAGSFSVAVRALISWWLVRASLASSS
jgi:hypothetical protein